MCATNRACVRPRLPLFAAVVLVLGAASAAAQTIKLNGPLARPIGGDVRGFQIDRTGKRVVYLADQEQDDVHELFSVRPGTPPIRVSAPLSADSDVDSFLLAPDGQRIAYMARLGATFGLFGVAVGGGPVVRLDAPPVERVLSGFQIDPTSTRVVFLGEPAGGERSLYSAPLDGSAPAVRLSGSDPVFPRFQVGGGRVVFQVVRSGVGSSIFSAPLDGSREPVQLAPFLASNNLSFQISPDGRRVLYVDGDLFAVGIDGRGPPVNLSRRRLPSQRVTEFRIAPDGQRAVYRLGPLYSVSVLGDEEPLPLNVSAVSFEITDEGEHVVLISEVALRRFRLLSIPILGGVPAVQLSGAANATHFRLAPGKRVVFVEDPEDLPTIPDELALRSVPVSGSEPSILLAPALVSPGVALELLVAGESVVYRAHSDAPAFDPAYELFTVPLDASRLPRRVNGELIAERDVLPGFAASGNGRQVAVLADQDFDEVFELFLAPAEGNLPALKLNPPLPVGRVEGDVYAAHYSADGSRAVYVADAREDEVYELFSVSASGGAAPVRLNEPLVPGGDVLYFEVTPERVVYSADQDVNDVQDLYSVPIGGGTPVPLEGVARGVYLFEPTPDGTRVVFAVDEGNLVFELHSAPVDSSAPSTQLASGLGPIDVNLFQTTPASDRVVYVADPDRDGEEDLFSVPVAGGVPVRLSEPAPAGRYFREFRITSDSQRVLYRLQAGTPAEIALFSAPVDGSSGPIELSAALPGSTLVTSFALSPDGARVVFAADGVVAQLYELFSMPVDGSTGPLRLQTAMAQRPEFTPDGTRAVFLVPITLGSFELHVVPADASALPLVIGGELRYDTAPAAMEKSLQITPDSTHVVFRAARTNRPFRLFGVPLDGSRPPVNLTRTRNEFDIVRDDFRLTPDGQTVVYRIGWGPVDYGSELFHVPVSGPRLPVRISSRPTVYAFDVSPDGRRVLHRTTQDDPLVIELYASRLTRSPPVLPR